MEQALKFMKRFVNDEKNLSIFDSIKDRERNAREDERKKTARNMLQDGVNIKTIIKYTGLSKEEIEVLNNTANL